MIVKSIGGIYEPKSVVISMRLCRSPHPRIQSIVDAAKKLCAVMVTSLIVEEKMQDCHKHGSIVSERIRLDTVNTLPRVHERMHSLGICYEECTIVQGGMVVGHQQLCSIRVSEPMCRADCLVANSNVGIHPQEPFAILFSFKKPIHDVNLIVGYWLDPLVHRKHHV